MKKFLSLIALVAALAPTTAGAQMLFGQEHYYAVLMRGNGEAVVSGKFIFTNREDAPQQKFKFKVKNNAELRNLVAFQEFGSYPVPLPLGVERGAYPYPQYGTRYQKLIIESDEGNYTVTLAEPIKKDATGTVLINFRTFSFTSKAVLGRRTFAIETFSVDDDVNTVQVSVNVEEDYALKGAKQEVSYAETREAVALPSAVGVGSDIAVSSPVLERFSQAIVRPGAVTKHAQSLAPGETFIVRGSYARHRIALYLIEITIALAAIILVVVVPTIIFARRKGKLPALVYALCAVMLVGIVAALWGYYHLPPSPRPYPYLY